MGTIIELNKDSYSEREVVNSWAADYVKRKMKEHTAACELDHPDGSVSMNKLAGDVKDELLKIPTKVSQLENDNGYLSQHQDISYKADMSYVDTAIADEKSERQIEDTKVRTDLGAVKVQIGELETRTANNESGVAEAKGRLLAVESMYGDLAAEIDEIDGQVSGCRGDINNMAPILHDTSVAVDELKDSKADKSSTYTKTDIDSKIGDIETALDSIIAIQSSLIGGGSV